MHIDTVDKPDFNSVYFKHTSCAEFQWSSSRLPVNNLALKDILGISVIGNTEGHSPWVEGFQSVGSPTRFDV
ncbi:MAG: hypothetical protein CMM16_05580 [Rhodospirillaceae bacterium]|nr:hypothetical protein [Rhodospirillaceae bacterium]